MKKMDSRTRPAKKKSGKVIKIWQDKDHCQGQTVSGTRCKIKQPLSVIKVKSGKNTYEVVACRHHIDRFTLHESLLP